MAELTKEVLRDLKAQGGVYHLVIDHQHYFRLRDMYSADQKKGFEDLSGTLLKFHEDLTEAQVPTVNVMTPSASQENVRDPRYADERAFYRNKKTMKLSKQKPEGQEKDIEFLKNVDFVQEGFEAQYTYVKTVNDAFAKDDLHKFLKEKNVKTLVVSGLYRDLCVDATVTHALKKGYNVVMALDAVDGKKPAENGEKRMEQSANYFSKFDGKKFYKGASEDIAKAFIETKDEIVPMVKPGFSFKKVLGLA